MSDTKPVPTEGILTQEQIDKISGGSCDAGDWIVIFDNLTQTYEKLIDTTSYVIERVYKAVQ